MNKYTPKLKGPDHKGRGRPVRPDTWITGPDETVRDQYYAHLKHRAQARFRGEEYNLTWEDWQELWRCCWQCRGRKATELSLYRIDNKLPWDTSNVVVVENALKAQYYQKDRVKGGRPRKHT